MAQKKKKNVNQEVKTVKKTDKIWTMLPAIFTGMLLLLFILSTIGDGFWLTLIGLRTWVVAALLAALVWVFVDELRKGLKNVNNESLSKGQKIRDWIKIALIVVCVVGFVVAKNADGVPMDESDIEPPFATMRGFTSGEVTDYQQTMHGKGLNRVREWSDIASPRNIEWSEQARVSVESGDSLVTISGSYRVFYHEAASVGIATSVAGEYYRKDSHKPDFEQYEGVEDIDADYANVYTIDEFNDVVLLRKGNIVVRATVFLQDGSDVSTLDVARTLADSIG